MLHGNGENTYLHLRQDLEVHWNIYLLPELLEKKIWIIFPRNAIIGVQICSTLLDKSNKNSKLPLCSDFQAK